MTVFIPLARCYRVCLSLFSNVVVYGAAKNLVNSYSIPCKRTRHIFVAEDIDIPMVAKNANSGWVL